MGKQVGRDLLPEAGAAKVRSTTNLVLYDVVVT